LSLPDALPISGLAAAALRGARRDRQDEASLPRLRLEGEDGPLARERDMRRYLVRGYERARQDHAFELESLRGRLIALDRLFTASGLELDAPSPPHQRALQGLARAGKAPS